MTETCRNCRFGHTIPYEGVDNVFCRLDPPEFLPPGSSTLKPVDPNGWCGKWQSGPDTTVSVPAPGSDPNTVRSQKLSVRTRPKKGVAATV